MDSENTAGNGGRVARTRASNKERREEAARRILDSARELICEKGIAGLTLSEAGERAGYSRGLAAHYYGHKEGLLVAVIEQIGIDVRSARKTVANWAPGLDTVVGVAGFYVGRNPVRDNTLRALHVLLSERVTSSGPVADALERLNAESVGIVEDYLRQGIAAGNIRADLDPHAAAVTIIGAMRGVSAQLLFSSNRTSAETLLQTFMEILRLGLRRGPAGR